MQNYEKILGVQNIFEDLLVWVAVIVYFGGMIYKAVKDNKNKQQKAAPTPVKAKPKLPQTPVAEFVPAEEAPTPVFENGVSDIVARLAEDRQEPAKRTVQSFSPRQRALRRAVLWSEILTKKF